MNSYPTWCKVDRLAAVVLCSVVLSGCDILGPDHGDPAFLRVVSGNQQVVPARDTIPEPLVVQLADSARRGVPGVLITWSVGSLKCPVARDHRIFPHETTTEADGMAQVRVAPDTNGALVYPSVTVDGEAEWPGNLGSRLTLVAPDWKEMAPFNIWIESEEQVPPPCYR